ncbi:Similar to Nep2: Neprilysin-2 (Drosophila melanogaster) [Cotesia congregata]|uniref:Similar to Nep2: Neprilysin-2 (Drosophila melanogaster) n=1 Tax=Cotesia congregata TaxID=51543 RepID=A0A8J2MLR3_COTCN|nr:Similar to Nep2: Neprilysin-2 (Drosophila melanogaster) [Cotesia congregata]
MNAWMLNKDVLLGITLFYNFTKFTSVFILYFNIPWTYKPELINILIGCLGLLNLHKMTKLWLSLLAIIVSIIITEASTNTDKCIFNKYCNNCSTQECLLDNLEFEINIVRNLKEDVDPCDDFYEYACGNFGNVSGFRAQLSPPQNLFAPLADQKRQLIELVQSSNSSNTFRPFNFINNYMTSCENLNEFNKQFNSEIRYKDIDVIKSVVSKLYEWPVVVGSQWNETDFDLIDINVKAESIGINSFAIYKPFVSLARGNILIYMSINEICITNVLYFMNQLSPAKLDFPSLNATNPSYSSSINSEIEYMVSVARLFGVNESQARVEFIESLEFERKLYDASVKNHSPPLNSTNNNNAITIKAAIEKWPTIKWMKIFEQHHFTNESVVIITNPDYITKLERLINETPKRVQANYIIWKTVEYLVEKLDEKDCIDELFLYLPELLASYWVRHSGVEERVKNSAYEIALNVKQVLIDTVNHTSWLDFKAKNDIIQYLQLVDFIFGATGTMLDDKKFEEFYQGLQITPDNYLMNFLNVSVFYERKLVSETQKPENQRDSTFAFKLFEFLSIDGYNEAYSGRIDIGALKYFYFSTNRPNFINYANFGHLIAHELGHVVDNRYKLDNKYYMRENNWGQLTNQKYQEVETCLIEQFNNYTYATTNETLDGQLLLDENIADNIGIKISYSTYQDWVKKHGKESIYSSSKFDANQLFWLSHANFYCDYQSKFASTSDKSHSPKDKRIIGSFSNSLDFATDFNCPLGSKMNPNDFLYIITPKDQTTVVIIRQPRGACVFFFFALFLCELQTKLWLSLLPIIVSIIITEASNNTNKCIFNKYCNSCSTQECIQDNLDFELKIQRNLKQDVDPCDDFYEYACGNFGNVSGSRARLSPPQNLLAPLADQKRQLIELVQSSNSSNTFRPFNFINNYMTSCENLNEFNKQFNSEIRYKDIDVIKSVVSKLYEWPVVVGSQWNETDFDLIDINVKAESIGINSFAIYKPFVSLARGNILIYMSINEICITNVLYFMNQLSPAKLDFPSLNATNPSYSSSINSEIDYMVSVARLFGVNESQARVEFIESLEFERKLYDASVKNHSPPLNSTNNNNAITIKAAIEKWPTIKWMKIFEQHHFTNESVVIITNPDYITKFERLINETPKRVQANYIIWKTVEYLVEKLDEKDCIDELFLYLPELLASYWVRHSGVEERVKNSAYEIALNVKQVLIDTVNHTSWLDVDAKNDIIQYLQLVDFIFGATGTMLDDKKFEEYYQGLQITPDNYLMNFLNVSVFYDRSFVSEIQKPENQGDSTFAFKLFEYLSSDGYNEAYSGRIDIGTLKYFYFSTNRPNFINYANFGHLIAHELGHVVDNRYKLDNKYYMRENNWGQLTNQKYQEVETCLIEQFNNYTYATTNETLDGQLLLDENIADNIGIKISYSAYQDWVKKNGKESIYSSSKFDANQLFWLSHANFYCDYQSKFASTSDKSHSPKDKRIIGSYSNSLDFATDFKCPLGSKMNPVKKCNFF